MKKQVIFLGVAVAMLCGNASFAKDLKDLRIYINPGHGGHDSDDRNVVVPPFTQGDPDGFWESNASLTKGFAMRDLLEQFGTTTMMSRTTNTTEDDRDLHEIGYEANDFGADFFFSIHSNATGTNVKKNQPLMLFRGETNNPQTPESKEMAIILNKHLLENRVTSWSSEAEWVAGDFTFYTDWSDGLGVLRKLTGPGLLSEGSYHDYIPETYRLLNDDYCWLEGYHFTKAIMEYFNTAEKYTTGVVAGTVYDSHLVRTDAVYGDTFFGHDKSLPICGATVELIDADDNVVGTYTTDQLQNGVFMFKSVAPGDYTLKVSHSEYRPYESTVSVTANNVTYLNPVVDRIRNTAPEVVEYSPKWTEGGEDVICNSSVSITFNWDMDTKSVENNFTITPAIDGDITWEDSQYKLVFKPKRAFDTNTLYTVTIGKDAKHPENISMGKDFSFQFLTGDYNTFDILASSPSSGSLVHYEKPYVEFRFAQQPNTSTIQNDIVVKNESGEVLPYNVRSKKFSSSKDEYGYFQIRLSNDLEIGKTYTVDVAANVRDEHDMPIEAPLSYTFEAVDASADKLSMVDGLDADGWLWATADKSAGVSSVTAARNTSTKLEGTASYKLDYEFAALDGGNAVYTFQYPENHQPQMFTADNCVGLKVYGDLSCNTLYAHFLGDSGEKLIKLCNLSFLGWRDVSVSLKDELESGSYLLSGLEVQQTGGQISRKGTIYVDKVSIGAAADAGVQPVVASQFRIYPNPASELVIANGNAPIVSLQLISLSGQLIKEANGNVLNVSDVSSGVYLINIMTTTGKETHRVAVAH